MANNSFAATIETSLSRMKYDFASNSDDLKYNTLEEISGQQQLDAPINENNNKSSYFKLEFYQKYFNVNTSDVFYR